jgi:hypothetical protein
VTFDNNGFNEYGYQANGTRYDKNGFTYKGIHKNGTKYDDEGYDRNGYNEGGYDKNGFDKNGINKNGSHLDDKGFALDGYNRYGFDRDGFNRGGYNKDGYNRDGYDKLGYNIYGYDKDGFNREGYNKDGYDREGYNILGLNKHGVDRTGYDKDGYNIYGFDRNGFDMEGYNKKGEFNEYIDLYLNRNKDIKKQTTSLIYTVEYKDIMLEIDRTMKFIGQGEYKAASNSLRTASEQLVNEILKKNNVSPQIKNSDLFSKLNYIENNKLIYNDYLQTLHNIRLLGNKGSHAGETTTREENEVLLNDFKNVLKNWINEVF